MLVGFLVAIATGVLAYLSQSRDERQTLAALVQSCEQESAKLICDPEVLQGLGASSGIQQEIITAQNGLTAIADRAAQLALVALLLFFSAIHLVLLAPSH